MRQITMTLLLAGAASFAFAQGAPSPILPGAVKWQTNPAGLESAWFVGAADKAGVYALRVKLPAGFRIQPHTHPDERFSVVLEGTIFVGFGETFDESKVVAIPAGAMYVAPAGVPHYVWAKDGPATYQETGPGPTATNFVKR